MNNTQYKIKSNIDNSEEMDIIKYIESTKLYNDCTDNDCTENYLHHIEYNNNTKIEHFYTGNGILKIYTPKN